MILSLRAFSANKLSALDMAGFKFSFFGSMVDFLQEHKNTKTRKVNVFIIKDKQ